MIRNLIMWLFMWVSKIKASPTATALLNTFLEVISTEGQALSTFVADKVREANTKFPEALGMSEEARAEMNASRASYVIKQTTESFPLVRKHVIEILMETAYRAFNILKEH
jgi:hypothetical protein